MANAYRDENSVPTLIGVSNADGFTPVRIYADPVTHRLLVDASGGSGTVTSVSVVTANGFAGTVANATTTPAITLTTTVTGILIGNGTAISAASPSTDYAAFAFKTISVATQSDVVADSPIDTLTLVAGTGMTITTNAGTDTITFAASGGAATSITVGTTTITSGTDTRILYDNAGTLGEYTITGTGTVVAMKTSPVFVTPTLGVASATTINKVTITAPATGSTLTIADGKTLTASVSMTLQGGDASVLSIAASKTVTISNTLTFTGTDTASVAFGGGGTVLYTASTIPLTVGTTTIASGTSTRILYDNAGVLGEYTLTGSGTVVAMQTAPTFVTSATVPLLIGGSGTTGTQLTLKTTTGNGTTDALAIVGGNNGATTFATFSTGALSILTTGVFTTGTIELGAASDTTIARVSAGVISVEGVTIPSISSTNTLTNKRITRRIVTVNAPGATPTTNTDNADIQNFTGVGAAITSMTTNLSGTPADGDLIEFRFLDDGNARAITWGTSFAATTVALPTTTVISTTLRVGFEWLASASKWQCIATC